MHYATIAFVAIYTDVLNSWRWLQHLPQSQVERRLEVSHITPPDSRCLYLNILLHPRETIPHAIRRFCLANDLDFLAEKYYVD